MHLLRVVIGIIVLSIANIASCENAEPDTQTLSAFDNTYTAKLYGFNINARSTLTAGSTKEPLRNVFTFSFNADSIIGDVNETTEFEWDKKQQKVIPLNYTYKRNSLGKNRNDHLIFEWDKGVVTNVKRDTHTPLDASKSIQDSLSYQIQLRQDLIAGKTKMQYNISNGGKLRQYEFDVVGEELLSTPLGDVRAVKVIRAHDKGEAETIAWFAKDFQYLLVRLQKEENGSAYTIYLSKASLDGKAIVHF